MSPKHLDVSVKVAAPRGFGGKIISSSAEVIIGTHSKNTLVRIYTWLKSAVIYTHSHVNFFLTNLKSQTRAVATQKVTKR